jgi:hypothetical protein
MVIEAAVAGELGPRMSSEHTEELTRYMDLDIPAVTTAGADVVLDMLTLFMAVESVSEAEAAEAAMPATVDAPDD